MSIRFNITDEKLRELYLDKFMFAKDIAALYGVPKYDVAIRLSKSGIHRTPEQKSAISKMVQANRDPAEVMASHAKGLAVRLKNAVDFADQRATRLGGKAKCSICGAERALTGRRYLNKEKLDICRSCAASNKTGSEAVRAGNRKRSVWMNTPKYRDAMVGPSNPRWKGGITAEQQRLRHSSEYRQWNRAVMERDDFTCQICEKRGGKLHAHHLQEWANFPEFRYVVGNGITLCKQCHVPVVHRGASRNKPISLDGIWQARELFRIGVLNLEVAA